MTVLGESEMQSDVPVYATRSRALKPWQVMAILAALLLGMFGSYGLFLLLAGDGETAASSDTQVVPVRRSDLVNQVTTNGSITFPEREELAFGAAGTIGEVLVEVGDVVAAGQLLATLDESSVAALARAVAEAEQALADAQERLDAAVAEADPLALSQAERDVVLAQAAVDAGAESLANLLNPGGEEARLAAEAAVLNAQAAVLQAEDLLEAAAAPAGDLDIASAELAIVTAQKALEAATDSLDAASAPAEDLGRLGAEAAVLTAEIALANARERLDELSNQVDPARVADARTAVDLASEAQTNSIADLALAESDWESKLSDAEAAVADRETAYAVSFVRWLGITPAGAELNAPPSDLVAAWGIDLDALFDSRVPPASNSSGDDPETPWNETIVFAWTFMNPVPVSGTCANGATSSKARCVESELDIAWDKLAAASASLAAVRAQAANALTAARAAVDKSSDAFTSAQDALDAARTTADELQIAQAAKTVAITDEELDNARDRLAALDELDELDVQVKERELEVAAARLADAVQAVADLRLEPLAAVPSGGRTPQAAATRVPLLAEEVEVEQARVSLMQAQQNLEAALDEELALEVPDESDIEMSRAELSVAEAALAAAGQNLADLAEVGQDQLLIALREAEVREAELKIDSARQAIASATIRAPWDGVVLSLPVEAGESVNPRTILAEIVDRSVVEVAATVDEIDVLSIIVGTEAVVTMDALPGTRLSGIVTEIGDAAQSQQGVVSFPVRVRVDLPPGISLAQGLSATASVVVSVDEDVLLIPLQAVGGSITQPTVRVVRDGDHDEVPVTLGNSDDFWVVVQDGLSEGDEVVMEVVGTSTAQFFGGFRTGGISIIGGGGGGIFRRPTGGGSGGGGDDH